MPFYVINGCFGGFGFSDEVKRIYISKGGIYDKYDDEIRYDPLFVDIIRNPDNYGIHDVNTSSSKLVCEDITDEVFNLRAFKISEYDGAESIEIDKNKINLNRILDLLKVSNVLGFNQDSTVDYLMTTFKLLY